MLKRQWEFPLLEKYKEYFKIDENTIFAYDEDIYTNNPLPIDLLAHEIVHLAQQKEYGVKKWVDKYLKDKKFRLKQELEAYKEQLKYYKDRNDKNRARIVFAEQLSSSLYKLDITKQEAFNLLK